MLAGQALDIANGMVLGQNEPVELARGPYGVDGDDLFILGLLLAGFHVMCKPGYLVDNVAEICAVAKDTLGLDSFSPF